MSANPVLQHLPHHVDLTVAVICIVVRRIDLMAVVIAYQLCCQLWLGAAATQTLLAWAAAERRLPTTRCPLTSSILHLLEAW
jgi:hypothetical protein